jgi:uncharacterized protein YecE (DUF72 family)
MKNIYVGTSGYQYKGWTDKFYPEDVKKKDWLPYYASRFNTVEINSSFYRLPAASTFAGWRDATPSNFVFTIKGSRFVTHQKRLREPEEPIERLFTAAAELGPKLGCVLWQFVERWPRDDERLGRLDYFCRQLSKHKVARNVHQAFELRHPTWFEEPTYDVLRKYDYALVVNQSSKWPEVKISTASWSYFRFHGPKALYASGYSDAQLKAWTKTARELTSKEGDFFAYFNNDVFVDAPKNAETLRDYLKG